MLTENFTVIWNLSFLIRALPFCVINYTIYITISNFYRATKYFHAMKLYRAG